MLVKGFKVTVKLEWIDGTPDAGNVRLLFVFSL